MNNHVTSKLEGDGEEMDDERFESSGSESELEEDISGDISDEEEA